MHVKIIYHNSISCASSSEKSLIELSLELELCSCSLKASSVAYFLIYSVTTTQLYNVKVTMDESMVSKVSGVLAHKPHISMGLEAVLWSALLSDVLHRYIPGC